jgi:hypothetical protein
MSNIIRDFKQVFDLYSVADTDETNYADTVKYFSIYHNVDCISFLSSINIIPSNLASINKNEDGLFYIEITLNRDSDIISKFELDNSENIKLELMVAGKGINITYDSIIIPFMAIYTELKLRFTFKSESININLVYKSYLLKDLLIRKLRQLTINCSGTTYTNGMALHSFMIM